jgi:hypothetical protein
MNKKLLLVSAAVLLLAASCSKKTAQTNTPPAPQASTQQTDKSFRDFLAMGTPQKCDTSFTSGNTASQGTMYVANGKMRGDFNAQVSGQTVATHIIVSNSVTYTWLDNSSTGYKVAANSQATSTSNSTHAPDLNQKVTTSCQPWTEDDSVFNLPTGVTFSDVNSMNPGMMDSSTMHSTSSMQHSTSSNTAACGACNNLQEPQKSQCRAALYCK